MAKTTFTLEYTISLLVALIVAGAINRASPNTNSFIKVLAGLLSAYLSLKIINFTFPKVNKYGYEVGTYIQNTAMTNMTTMGYAQIFPPLLAVLIIFMILLYNRNLN